MRKLETGRTERNRKKAAKKPGCVLHTSGQQKALASSQARQTDRLAGAALAPRASTHTHAMNREEKLYLLHKANSFHTFPTGLVGMSGLYSTEREFAREKQKELQCFRDAAQDKHCISDSLRFVRMIKPLGNLHKRLHGAAQVAGFAIADRQSVLVAMAGE